MWRLLADGTSILLLRRSKPFGSIDYQPFMEVYFVAIGLLGRAERMSQCRVSRFTTIAV